MGAHHITRCRRMSRAGAINSATPRYAVLLTANLCPVPRRNAPKPPAMGANHITRCGRTSRAGATDAAPPLASTPRSVQLRAAPRRTASHRGPFGAPHPTSQPTVVRWADVHQRRIAHRCPAPRRTSTLCVAPCNNAQGPRKGANFQHDPPGPAQRSAAMPSTARPRRWNTPGLPPWSPWASRHKCRPVEVCWWCQGRHPEPASTKR